MTKKLLIITITALTMSGCVAYVEPAPSVYVAPSPVVYGGYYRPAPVYVNPRPYYRPAYRPAYRPYYNRPYYNGGGGRIIQRRY